jgi:hypothetical protein
MRQVFLWRIAAPALRRGSRTFGSAVTAAAVALAPAAAIALFSDSFVYIYVPNVL